MADLQGLLTADLGATLYEADNINEREEIVAFQAARWVQRSFLLRTCLPADPNLEGLLAPDLDDGQFMIEARKALEAKVQKRRTQ